jgi:hypothetical protein
VLEKYFRLFSLALLAKFLFQRKPLAFWYWYKTPILKQPHPHYLDIRWHKLYSSHTLKERSPDSLLSGL